MVEQFLAALDTKLKYVKNGGTKYFGLLSSIVFKDVMAHFKDEAGPDGPWVEWSKNYRRKTGKKLQDTGRLRNSFKPEKYRNSSAGMIWFNDAHTKTGYPYAAGHNYGGSMPGRPPKREFMWLSDKAMDQVSVQTLQFMLDEGVF